MSYFSEDERKKLSKLYKQYNEGELKRSAKERFEDVERMVKELYEIVLAIEPAIIDDDE